MFYLQVAVRCPLLLAVMLLLSVVGGCFLCGAMFVLCCLSFGRVLLAVRMLPLFAVCL